MKFYEITECKACHTRIIPTQNGKCPSCGSSILDTNLIEIEPAKNRNETECKNSDADNKTNPDACHESNLVNETIRNQIDNTKDGGGGFITFIVTLLVVLFLIYGFNLFFTSARPRSNSNTTFQSGGVEIVSSSWHPYGNGESIEWSVSVKNNSGKYIEWVDVSITTEDSNGKIITNKSALVRAIPPGEIRSRSSTVLRYGNESNARYSTGEILYAPQK